jgi:YjjG family noncanonical pyrimidine nucleotidase
MRKYKHLFFDLDHTLWDFERNSEETLKELFDGLEMSRLGDFSFEDLMKNFRSINQHLWTLYDYHQIDRQFIRSQRFEMVRQAINAAPNPIFEQLNDIYMERCPQKPHLIPYAGEILAYLAGKNYALHIISNGFEAIQRIKMKNSGILDYFSVIVTSETIAARKPNKEIFDYALQKSNASLENALMIGDNLITDIGGSNNAGIDNLFYNPEKVKHQANVNFEITNLNEIEGIL